MQVHKVSSIMESQCMTKVTPIMDSQCMSRRAHYIQFPLVEDTVVGFCIYILSFLTLHSASFISTLKYPLSSDRGSQVGSRQVSIMVREYMRSPVEEVNLLLFFPVFPLFFFFSLFFFFFRDIVIFMRNIEKH